MLRSRLRVAFLSLGFVASSTAVLAACGSEGSTSPIIEDRLTSIRVTPNVITLDVGETARLQAQGYNQFGDPMQGITFNWVSLLSEIAEVDQSGNVTGVRAGSTLVSAVSGTVTGAAQVEVLEPVPPVQIVTQTLPARPVGLPYSVQLDAAGGQGAISWSVVAGTLPGGLTLSSGGLLSGTPTTPGASTFTLEATDGTRSNTLEYVLTISDVGGPVGMGSIYMGSAYFGRPYTFVPTLTGGDGTYTFSISEGTLPAGLSLNTQTGEISGTPTEPGVEFFRLRVESGGSSARRSLSLAVSSRPPEEFNMTIFNVANDPPSERILDFLSQVVLRYEEIISGDLPGGSYPPGSALPSCDGLGPLMDGTFVDDMTILTNIGPIDGPSNIIGFAGPCDLIENNDAGQPVTTFGRLTLDDADLDRLDDGQLFGLMWHEIAHIVGIGSLWRTGQPPGYELLEGAGAFQQYIGTNANREFKELGGQTPFIVVEPQVAGHWDETSYDHALMTPQIEAPGVEMPITAFTVGSFQDMSYEADPDKADPYTLPSGAPPRVARPGDVGLDLSGDIPNEAMRLVRRDGSIAWIMPRAVTGGGDR